VSKSVWVCVCVCVYVVGSVHVCVKESRRAGGGCERGWQL